MSDSERNFLDVGFDQQTLKVRSVRGAAATFASQATKFLLRLGSIAILARLLSPADFGLVAMVAPIVALAQTLNEIGLAQAVVQRDDITPSQVSGLFWVSFAVSLVLACLLLTMSPLVSWIYAEPAAGHILKVMAVVVVIGSLGLVPTALLYRKMLFVSVAVIEILTTVAGLIVSVGAAWLGYGYWSLVYGQVTAAALNLILVFAAARWRPVRPRIDAGLRPMVGFGASLTGVNLASYAMISADNLIVGAVVGKTGLGIYDRSYALVVQPLAQIMSPVGRVAIPLLSRLTTNPDLFRSTFVNMLKISLMLTTPGMIVLIAFAAPVVGYVLGRDWYAATPVFAWLCLGGIAVPLYGAASWVFVSQGRAHQQFVYSVITSSIGVASFVLGVTWGIKGVAITAAISFFFIQTPIIVWGSTRGGLIRIGDFFTAVWPSVAAAVFTSAALLPIGNRPSFVALIFIMALSYVIFAACLYFLPGGAALFKTIVGMRAALRRNSSD